MGKIYKDDIGKLIRLDTGVDISSATYTSILVRKPSEDVEWLATVDPTADTFLTYTSATTDFDEDGEYQLQAYVIFCDGASEHRGETVNLIVYNFFE